MKNQSTCTRWSEFLQGDPSEAEQISFEQHCLECAECGEWMSPEKEQELDALVRQAMQQLPISAEWSVGVRQLLEQQARLLPSEHQVVLLSQSQATQHWPSTWWIAASIVIALLTVAGWSTWPKPLVQSKPSMSHTAPLKPPASSPNKERILVQSASPRSRDAQSQRGVLVASHGPGLIDDDSIDVFVAFHFQDVELPAIPDQKP